MQLRVGTMQIMFTPLPYKDDSRWPTRDDLHSHTGLYLAQMSDFKGV